MHIYLAASVGLLSGSALMTAYFILRGTANVGTAGFLAILAINAMVSLITSGVK